MTTSLADLLDRYHALIVELDLVRLRISNLYGDIAWSGEGERFELGRRLMVRDLELLQELLHKEAEEVKHQILAEDPRTYGLLPLRKP